MYIEIQRSKDIQGNPWTHAIRYRGVWVASSLLHVGLGRIALWVSLGILALFLWERVSRVCMSIFSRGQKPFAFLFCKLCVHISSLFFHGDNDHFIFGSSLHTRYSVKPYEIAILLGQNGQRPVISDGSA